MKIICIFIAERTTNSLVVKNEAIMDSSSAHALLLRRWSRGYVKYFFNVLHHFFVKQFQGFD